jgi:hypothetical protein
MNETKPWWASRGVWGGIILVLSLIIGAFGYSGLTPEEQTVLGDSITNLAAVLGTVIGTILAIWGRIKASKQVTASK